MANRTRNIVLRVPVTAEERAMIERKMQQMGTGCFSVYARKMLIDGYVIRLDYSDMKAINDRRAAKNRHKHQSDCKARERYGNALCAGH